MIACSVHSVLILTHKALNWKRLMFRKTLLPFPLAYDTTVFESKLNCLWAVVGKGKDNSDTEIQPFSPWLLVDLNLGKKKRESRFFKDSKKSTFQSIFSRILHAQLSQKYFWLDGALSLQGTPKCSFKGRKRALISGSSWCRAGALVAYSSPWDRIGDRSSAWTLCVIQNPLVTWGPWSALGWGSPTHSAWT